MRLLRTLFPLMVLCALAISARSADDNWQAARIVDVQKSVDTQTMYWVANTPVTRDETTYRISVHYKDKILAGLYTPSRSQSPPPEEWTQERLVKVRLVGDSMYLLAISGNEYKVRIARRKNASMLPDVSAAELEKAYAQTDTESQRESPIGFSKSGDDTDPSSSTEERPATEERAPVAATETVASGTVSTTTVPYLADVYVDGNRVGYSPAKVTLPAGKHVVRFEKQGYKSWSKEVIVEPNADVALDATLSKSK